MSHAEVDQGQTVKHPRDAQTLIAGSKTEPLPVPISREPGVQYPGARHHHCGFAAAEPGTYDSRRGKDLGHSEQQHPNQQVGQQHAGGNGGGVFPKQAQATCEGNEGAEIDQHFACGHTLGYRLPHRDEIALDQPQNSEADHGRRKQRLTRARDGHHSICGGVPFHRGINVTGAGP